MTKAEIKALVSAKIAGQGNQVDCGGVLASILDAIVDIIPSAEPSVFVPLADFETEEISVGEAVTKYGLTDEIFDNICSGKYQFVALDADGIQKYAVTSADSTDTEEKFCCCASVAEVESAVSISSLSISITLDGKYNIVLSPES